METSDELTAHSSGALGKVPDTAVNKAYFIGDENGTQSQILHEPDKQQSLFQASGALMPLYDPAGLAVIFENSSCLRSCVDAMVTNVDSFGQQFIPTIDLTLPNADDLIRNALRIERKQGKRLALPDHIGKDDEPTTKEVADRRKLLEVEIPEERAKLETFFENCTVDMPFAGPEGLRGLTRADLEIQGNAYWEILRNSFGEIAQFNHVPATSVRLWPLDDENTETQITEKVSLLTSKKKAVRKKYRRFVQCWEANTKVVYFKEYGDPRCVSAKTGHAYKDKAELQATEGKEGGPVVEATELFWFKISSQRTSYGAPRWIGTLLAVLGNRQSEEGNFIYFENRSVPPLAVLVSGGRLHSDSVAKLESHIQNNIKGSRNNHKILILEAERVDSQAVGAAAAGAGAQARMKIEIVPLTDSQQKDALFQNYDEHNMDKIGQSFRLPRLLRGDVRDFNRSTAEASIDFAEVQVFGPIRQEFDWRINKRVLAEMGIKYHVFRSNSPAVRDPTALSLIIERLVKAMVITPEEARTLSTGVFNHELPIIDSPWVKQPIALTLAGRQIEDNKATPGDESTRYHDDQVVPVTGKDGKVDSGAGVNGFHYQTSGTSATQDQLGADNGMGAGVEKRGRERGVGKNVFAGEGEGDEGDDVSPNQLFDDEDDDKPTRGKRLPRAARTLVKLHKNFVEAEREQAAKVWAGFERQIITLPKEEFESLFVKEE
jgi:PBSX family phage portal protein